MAETLLQTYLNNQFIKTAEEGNIAILKKIAKDIAGKLEKKKTKIIPYTLVAIDPLISEDDPVVLEVERIIITKWKTFKNSVVKTKEKSTTYIRAVILEALHLLSKDSSNAALIWHTSRNIVKYYQLAGEKQIVSDFLQNIGNQVEIVGQEKWGINQISILNTIKLSENRLGQIDEVNIDQSKLQSSLLSAIQEVTLIGNYQTRKITGQAKFANASSAGLASIINEALSVQKLSLNKITSSIEKSFNNSLSKIDTLVTSLSTSMLESAIANNKRSILLWWKQSLYSPILENSYHSVGDPFNTAMIMALDLSEMVESIYPHSVDFLLKETLKDVHGNHIYKSESFSHWFNLAPGLGEYEKSLFDPIADGSIGRKPLSAVLANHLKNGIPDSEIFSQTGIKTEAQISLADLAVWVFHDLQSSKIAKSK